MNRGKTSLTHKEKMKQILEMNLPNNNPLYKILEEGRVGEKELEEIYIAVSMAIAIDRKKIANSISVALGCRTITRDREQMFSEWEIRYKMRENYTLSQRRFFENCIVYGWHKTKEVVAIGGEIRNMFRGLMCDTEINKDYDSHGINIQKLIYKLENKPSEYKNIIRTTLISIKEYAIFFERIDKLERTAIFLIGNISKQVLRIKKGQKRMIISLNKNKEEEVF